MLLENLVCLRAHAAWKAIFSDEAMTVRKQSDSRLYVRSDICQVAVRAKGVMIYAVLCYLTFLNTYNQIKCMQRISSDGFRPGPFQLRFAYLGSVTTYPNVSRIVFQFF